MKPELLTENQTLRRFTNLGLKSSELVSLCQSAIEKFLASTDEPDDETILVRTIKTQNREQKAQQSYEQNIKLFEKRENFAGYPQQVSSMLSE